MKVLVMGGTQFVSSSVAKYLIGRGYTVDIFTRGVKPIEYDGVRRHLQGDRGSIEDLKANISMEKYDYVFDISAYTKEDVENLTKVLNRENLKRYIFCSSGSVYIPSHEVVTEEFTRGENVNWGKYGLNKKKAEDYLFNLYEAEGFPVTIFRPTYIYGDGNNLYREIYLFDRISRGLDIPIPDGNKKTQFIYIDDLVKIFESAIHVDEAIGQAYNVTHPKFAAWQQLVETAMKVVGKKVNIIKVDDKKLDTLDINVREFFPFRNVTYLLDTKKLQNHGLYVPKVNLFEGMKKTYKWYCDSKPEVKDDRMNKMDLLLECTI
ncbi:SDR family oxidoreductase [Haloimpatiens massiliensis]|uniref:SDR family oxidoreductase n=1 Tax=Haloimpatiens massiliensis TaxID=1658110 RepID=UPI000C820F87|nr:SDR family oxidoreductase [Haloimpatiens massiliensis]